MAASGRVRVPGRPPRGPTARPPDAPEPGAAPAPGSSVASPYPYPYGTGRDAGQAAAVAFWRVMRTTSRASASVSTAGGEPGSGLRALSDIRQTAIPPMTAAAIM